MIIKVVKVVVAKFLLANSIFIRVLCNSETFTLFCSRFFIIVRVQYQTKNID